MTVNDRLISTHIPKMDEEQNERESEKKCKICWQHGHKRNNCLNISPS